MSQFSEQGLWYRGCGTCKHTLIPSLYRHPTKKDVNSIIAMEVELLRRFKQRSVPYLTRAVHEPWDYLFLMQHFGVPTRLLDWTENPHIALFFALTSPPANSNTPTDDAAVWVLDPVAWNRSALNHLSYKRGILSGTDEHLKGYMPRSENVDVDLIPNEPVALYGTHNSPRIVAQRGAFTVFGKEVTPMEESHARIKAHSDVLTRVVIPSGTILSLRSSLAKIGITDSVIFPDLDGLAKELKRYSGFQV
ncbi:FRG domain-containing protein [Archangium lansingense]|uniref:FRG domain-containing protein n=1 Tax=Archangium lansingense TaxID=2995310 RepID=A0ABT4A0C2_9BACT|nr:FRG domain-containing protein [Archangium lansinium]MCY1075095.1 FRG domain-containing protein [Archangium lansinium]